CVNSTNKRRTFHEHSVPLVAKNFRNDFQTLLSATCDDDIIKITADRKNSLESFFCFSSQGRVSFCDAILKGWNCHILKNILRNFSDFRYRNCFIGGTSSGKCNDIWILSCHFQNFTYGRWLYILNTI